MITITLAMPSSAATSSGTSATTPPSINVCPASSTGGNTPGNAELATIANTTSPDSRMKGRPVARSVVMIVSGIGACSMRRAPRCLRRKAMPCRLSRNEARLPAKRQRHSPGVHAQQISPPDVGPDAFETADAFGVARPGKQRRVHRPCRYADQAIRSQAGSGQRIEHADLIRGERAAAGKHEGKWSRQRSKCVDLHCCIVPCSARRFLTGATFPTHPPSVTLTS